MIFCLEISNKFSTKLFDESQEEKYLRLIKVLF